MIYSSCPVCGKKTFVDVEGPRLNYGCHSVPPREAYRLRMLTELEKECGIEPNDFVAGERVQVHPDNDETWELMEVRTSPGTVDNVDDDTVVVNLDSGQAVPYDFRELERVDAS